MNTQKLFKITSEVIKTFTTLALTKCINYSNRVDELNKLSLTDNTIRLRKEFCFDKTYKYYTKEYSEQIIKFIQPDLNIVRSFNSVRLDEIYNFTTVYYSTDARTYNRLYSAVKFEVIANNEIFKELNEEDKIRLATVYTIYFSKNINISAVRFDENTKQIIYSYFTIDFLINIATQIIKEVYTDANFDILDLNENTKTLNINYKYNKTKRFTAEELNEIITSFNHKPSVAELVEAINRPIQSKIDEYCNNEQIDLNTLDEMQSKLVQRTLIHKYIKMYNLTELINIQSRKK